MELVNDSKKESVLGGVLLVAGCCIGAGMLGLPVISIAGGYIPTTILLFLCCMFMACTGLLILEAVLYFKRETNLIALAEFAFGRIGKIVTVVSFLFVFNCLLVAYTAGGSALSATILSNMFGFSISTTAATFINAGVVGALIYSGAHAIDHVNRVLMIGLIGAYMALVVIGASAADPGNLGMMNFKASLAAIPIFLVSFGYGNLVPSLVTYMNRNVKKLRTSILIGSMIPFVIYVIWNAVILGLVSSAAQLNAISNSAEMVTDLLKNASQSKYVLICANLFSICALVTSFLTNALSCVDFIRDGCGLHNSRNYRGLICFLVLMPATILSLSFPHLFLKALGYAGGAATLFLFGLLPATAVYKARYKAGLQGEYQVAGGKLLLIFVMCMSVVLLILEIASKF